MQQDLGIRHIDRDFVGPRRCTRTSIVPYHNSGKEINFPVADARYRIGLFYLFL